MFCFAKTTTLVGVHYSVQPQKFVGCLYKPRSLKHINAAVKVVQKVALQIRL